MYLLECGAYTAWLTIVNNRTTSLILWSAYLYLLWNCIIVSLWLEWYLEQLKMPCSADDHCGKFKLLLCRTGVDPNIDCDLMASLAPRIQLFVGWKQRPIASSLAVNYLVQKQTLSILHSHVCPHIFISLVSRGIYIISVVVVRSIETRTTYYLVYLLFCQGIPQLETIEEEINAQQVIQKHPRHRESMCARDISKARVYEFLVLSYLATQIPHLQTSLKVLKMASWPSLQY